MHLNRRAMAIAATALLLEGCTVGPKYHPPAAPTISTYVPQPPATVSSSGPAGISQHFDAAAEIPAQWWTLFHSQELNRMVEEALASSPALEEAAARLKEAQEELIARTGQTKYPMVSGNASVEEQQLNLSAYGIPFPNPSPFTLLNGSVAVSYALDLFGANRHLVEGLKAERDYEAWQLEGARLMLAGNVVSSAIRQAQLRKQIELTQQLLSLEEQELNIYEQRFSAGGIAERDLNNQREIVAQTRATLLPLQQQLDALNDQLAVLMGRPPAEAHIAAISLDQVQLPQELPLSLPSSLARQRPDIRAAESLLHQASANVGVATADRYPQVILTGGGGGVGTRFTTGGDVWNVGLSLAQPIYNGGALRAEQRKAEAAYQAAGSAYQQTVLQAFEQVADALYAIEHDAETQQARSEASVEAEANFHIAEGCFRAGGISQTTLLEAQRAEVQSELDGTMATAARFEDSATLLQALGGGWWNQGNGHQAAAKLPAGAR